MRLISELWKDIGVYKGVDYKSGISIKKVTRCLNGELETYMDSKWIYLRDYERLNPNY